MKQRLSLGTMLAMALSLMACSVARGGVDIDFANGTWSHPNGVSTSGWDKTQSTGSTVLADGTGVTVTVTAVGSADPTNKNMTYFSESYFVGFALQQDPHAVENTSSLDDYIRVDMEFSEPVIVETFVMNDVDAAEVIQIEGWTGAPGVPGSGITAEYDPGDYVEEYTFAGVLGVTPKASAPTYLTLDPEALVGVEFNTYVEGFSMYYWWKGGVSVSVITIGFEGDLVVSKYRPRLYYTFEFVNDNGAPVEVDFFDSLPAGVVWDAGYTPETTNGLSPSLTFSNGNRDASITGLSLPSGTSTMKLRTEKTEELGTIENEATIDYDGDGPEGITADASILLTR